MLTRREIRRWFTEDAVVDPVDTPRGEQLRLLTALARVYEQAGLLTEVGSPPLWDCCACRAECWAGAESARPSRRDGRSGISLPWIGPGYRAGGVVVVAINLRDAGGRLVEYEITRSGVDDESSQLNRLAAGYRKAHGSRIAYASARSAAVVQDWLDERPVRDHDDPMELYAALNGSARLQAVKCSPDDGARSSPTPAMERNCPRQLLEDELCVLRPGAVLTLGAAAWHAVYGMSTYSEAPGGTDRLSYGSLRVGGRSYPVFSLDHPASGGLWDRGHRDLVAELRTLDRSVLQRPSEAERAPSPRFTAA